MSTETKTVYQLDRHHCYLCTTVADRDPMVENNWLIPAGCVETAPPQTGKNQAAQWQQESQTWRIIPDYRGQTAYRTDTWQHDGIAADTVTEPGELPAGLTIEPPPSSLHTWDGKAWVLDAETAAALKQAQQEEMWTRIKAKREEQRYGGAYIPALKKWLQTDEPSRTQYLQLQLLEAKGLFKQPVRWKTMDNSFIGLDAAAVTAIALQIMDNEQVDFANAERHRAAMLKADNPLDYDYSDGWTEIYQAA
nr:MAG TPA: tail fiber assembly protein [Caudoviricetes sp.]